MGALTYADDARKLSSGDTRPSWHVLYKLQHSQAFGNARGRVEEKETAEDNDPDHAKVNGTDPMPVR